MFSKYRRFLLVAVLFTLAFTFTDRSVISNAQSATGVQSTRVGITCSTISVIQVNFNTNGGWAGNRGWAGNTTLFDDYTGVGNHFAVMPANTNILGYPPYLITFAEQAVGTVITTRVYRALSPVPGSWDNGSYVDHSFTCFHGAHLDYPTTTLSCSRFHARGAIGQSSGYVGGRVWKGAAYGTPLYDDYTMASGNFAVITPQAGSGFDINFDFPAQPPGTQITARVYRALKTAPGSWDGADYQDITVNSCA